MEHVDAKTVISHKSRAAFVPDRAAGAAFVVTLVLGFFMAARVQPVFAGGVTIPPPGLASDRRELQRHPWLAAVPQPVLANAIAAGAFAVVHLDRDALLLGAWGLPANAVVAVLQGQLAAGLFDGKALAGRLAEQQRVAGLSQEERKDESLIKPEPLARLARKNLALFGPGDVFVPKSLAALGDAAAAFFSPAPVTYVIIDNVALVELASAAPAFAQHIQRGLMAGRDRLEQVVGSRQELLDFFVRHGISVGGPSIRVRQLDLCIDCKQCEDACEARYGARRLTLGGYQIGMVDVVFTCRTCTDQRCIDPCEYDSISYDRERREVVINEATCVGCTACAQACPYHAIDMVDVMEPHGPGYSEGFVARLTAAGSLAFGAGTPRVARPRRIANKCDHCSDYHDQACVSACPTGSLIELAPQALFHERLTAPHGEVLPPEPFENGLGVRDAGEARIRRLRWLPLAFWVIGLGAFAVALGEVLLRLYAPSWSYLLAQLKADPANTTLPANALLERVTFRAGDPLSVWLGMIGTALMAVAAIYPVFRRWRAFRWLAANSMWFDFHLMAGVVGPLFIILHSALRLGTWVSLAFWSMVIVVASGALGRYLYTVVPKLAGGSDLEELGLAGQLAALRAKSIGASHVVDRELAVGRRAAEAMAATSSVFVAVCWLLWEDCKRPSDAIARMLRLRRTGAPRDLRVLAHHVASRMRYLERRRVIAPKAQQFLNSWKKVHVPFTVLLTGFSAVHIWLAWSRAW